MKKLVITGGHAGTTALATIEAFGDRKDASEWEIHWIGPKYAMEGAKSRSLEIKVLPGMGVSCHPIVSGKIQSKFTRHTIGAILRIPVGFLHAFYLIVKIRPNVILSFGGYAGFPVVFSGWLLGKPVIIHEQIVAAGLGNRLSAPFATKIAVARASSMKYFPKNKVEVVGNPMMKKIAQIGPKLNVPSRPVIYFTGGSRGSRNINKIVEKSLPSLTKKYKVIHQVGELDWRKFKDIKIKNYECFAFVDPMEVYKIYEQCDLVIGRAGANTVSEVLAAGRPAIYIPIAWTRFDEQTKNAEYAERVGMARIIKQDEFGTDRLMDEISSILDDWKSWSKAGKTKAATFDEKAASTLVEMLLGVVR